MTDHAIPVIETVRLRLRPFRADDLDDHAAMLADPALARHLGAGPAAWRPRNRDEAWTHLAVLIGQWTLRGYGCFAVEERSGHVFIGSAGVLHLAGWPEPELVYALATPFQGRGYATEACRAILDWAWRTVPAERLVSYIRAGHVASERVAARLGAVREGGILLFSTPCDVWVHRRFPRAVA